MNGRNGIEKMAVLACAAGLLAASPAAELELAWTLKDGRVEKETAPLVEKDGALTFSLSAAAIRAKGAKRLEMAPDFATARKGDAGYWVVPTGQYGTFLQLAVDEHVWHEGTREDVGRVRDGAQVLLHGEGLGARRRLPHELRAQRGAVRGPLRGLFDRVP